MALDFVADFDRLKRVTSDCKAWPAGGKLARCRDCGLVLTLTDAQWHADAASIYADYMIYRQSDGLEQPIFDNITGAGQTRSAAIVKAIQQRAALPAAGRLLDIGCGNGAFLQAFSQAFSGWDLYGCEVSKKYVSVMESIPGFKQLFTCEPTEIPGTYDVIVLVHALEHIPSPTELLRSLRAKLNPGGWLFVEVPDCVQNPYVLRVADHSTHFSADMLNAVVLQAGFEQIQSGTDWVAKEISLIARLPAGAGPQTAARIPAPDGQAVFRGAAFLTHVLAQVDPLTRRNNFGILGTSIAATWLDAQTEGAAKFFVDENPSCIGKQHQGRPILAVASIPDGAAVYVALPPPMAARVAARLHASRPAVEFVTP